MTRIVSFGKAKRLAEFIFSSDHDAIVEVKSVRAKKKTPWLPKGLSNCFDGAVSLLE